MAPVYGAIASFVRMMPSFRDTRSGRRKSKQTKVVLGGLGLFIILAGHNTPLIIVCGVVLMAAAVPLPLPEGQRRSIIHRLRGMRTRDIEVRRSGRLVHDGRRLLLYDDGERDRRVLTNRPFRLQTFADTEGRGTYIEVAPADAKKKRESIWILVEDQAPDADAETVKPWRVDLPAHVDASLIGRLAALLRREHDLHSD